MSCKWLKVIKVGCWKFTTVVGAYFAAPRSAAVNLFIEWSNQNNILFIECLGDPKEDGIKLRSIYSSSHHILSLKTMESLAVADCLPERATVTANCSDSFSSPLPPPPPSAASPPSRRKIDRK